MVGCGFGTKSLGPGLDKNVGQNTTVNPFPPSTWHKHWNLWRISSVLGFIGTILNGFVLGNFYEERKSFLTVVNLMIWWTQTKWDFLISMFEFRMNHLYCLFYSMIAITFRNYVLMSSQTFIETYLGRKRVGHNLTGLPTFLAPTRSSRNANVCLSVRFKLV